MYDNVNIISSNISSFYYCFMFCDLFLIYNFKIFCITLFYFLTGQSLSSQYLLTAIYTISTLEPSECHLADGWGPTERGGNAGYCITDKTYMVYGIKRPLQLVAHYALRCKRLFGQARQEALQKCIPRDDTSVRS